MDRRKQRKEERDGCEASCFGRQWFEESRSSKIIPENTVERRTATYICPCQRISSKWMTCTALSPSSLHPTRNARLLSHACPPLAVTFLATDDDGFCTWCRSQHILLWAIHSTAEGLLVVVMNQGVASIEYVYHVIHPGSSRTESFPRSRRDILKPFWGGWNSIKNT